MTTTTELDVPDLEELIRVNEAARMLKVSLKQAYRWIDAGRLPAWRIVGKKYVCRSDVLAMVEPVEPKRRAAPAEDGGRDKRREVEQWRADVRKRSRI